MIDFLKYMIGNIYKILPLNDENNCGVQEHIDSVTIQLIGALDTYPELKANQRYISIINSMNFLRKNDYTQRQCKREILRCTNTLQKLIDRR